MSWFRRTRPTEQSPVAAILLYWLADHDDDMFLTPEQLEAKHTAQVRPLPPSELPVFARGIPTPQPATDTEPTGP